MQNYPCTFNKLTYQTVFIFASFSIILCRASVRGSLVKTFVGCNFPDFTTDGASYIATSGGNANGKNCVFPFTFEGVERRNCVAFGATNSQFCGTTANYDQDNEYGICNCDTGLFPFVAFFARTKLEYMGVIRVPSVANRKGERYRFLLTNSDWISFCHPNLTWMYSHVQIGRQVASEIPRDFIRSWEGIMLTLCRPFSPWNRAGSLFWSLSLDSFSWTFLHQSLFHETCRDLLPFLVLAQKQTDKGHPVIFFKSPVLSQWNQAGSLKEQEYTCWKDAFTRESIVFCRPVHMSWILCRTVQCWSIGHCSQRRKHPSWANYVLLLFLDVQWPDPNWMHLNSWCGRPWL